MINNELVKNLENFGSPEYNAIKEQWMSKYGNILPSQYWTETASLAFDDDWRKSRKWEKPKCDPTPLPDFEYQGVKFGRETFAQDAMLEAKREFLQIYKDALGSSDWKRVLTTTFDEIWIGKRLDVFENLDYTPCDELLRIRKFLLDAGFRDCGCCEPRYKVKKW